MLLTHDREVECTPQQRGQDALRGSHVSYVKLFMEKNNTLIDITNLSSIFSSSASLKCGGNLDPFISGESAASCAGKAMSSKDSRRVTDSEILRSR